jgi:GcrA cell cycle regulator
LNNPDNQAAMGIGVRGMPHTMTRAATEALQRSRDIKNANTIWGDPANVERLKQLKAQGRSLNEIASELGVSRGTIAGKLDRLGADVSATPAGPAAPGLAQLKFMAAPAEEIDPAEMNQFLKIFGGN